MAFTYPTQREAFIERLLYLGRNLVALDPSITHTKRNRSLQDIAARYGGVWTKTMKEAENWEDKDLEEILTTVKGIDSFIINAIREIRI